MQEAWTARLKQLQDSLSEASCHTLNTHDALCLSVPNLTEYLSADEHLNRAGKIDVDCPCCIVFKIAEPFAAMSSPVIQTKQMKIIEASAAFMQGKA